MMMPREAERIDDGLRHLALLRVLNLVLVIAATPGIVGAYWISGSSTVAQVVVGMFAMTGLVLGALTLRARCPRCRRLFHARGVHVSAWASQCLHCGLSLAVPAEARVL
jgi:hypothetical protein